MTLYDIALFVHVVAAIALVGGGFFEQLSVRLLERSRTVDRARGHAGWLAIYGRASGPIAAVVLVAGLFLAFDGDWWGAGWPGVALALFALAGTLAFSQVEPCVQRMVARLDEEPDGPASTELLSGLIEPRLRRISALLLTVDVAIVLLMTAKPDLTFSLGTAAVALVLGSVLGERAARRGRTPSAPTAPAAPAV